MPSLARSARVFRAFENPAEQDIRTSLACHRHFGTSISRRTLASLQQHWGQLQRVFCLMCSITAEHRLLRHRTLSRVAPPGRLRASEGAGGCALMSPASGSFSGTTLASPDSRSAKIPQRIIVDTDIGGDIDDTFAVTLALHYAVPNLRFSLRTNLSAYRPEHRRCGSGYCFRVNAREVALTRLSRSTERVRCPGHVELPELARGHSIPPGLTDRLSFGFFRTSSWIHRSYPAML